MANLEAIKALNLRYKKTSPIVSSTEGEFAKAMIQERFNPAGIEKAYSNAFAKMGANYVKYFDQGLPAEVALLYIDICSFSTRFAHLSGKEIGELFDEYYDLIIPIIYKQSGEIDKIMGDGIICSFGPPFYNFGLTLSILAANACAKEIINVTAGTKFESKIAFHSGTINYFKNKSGFYNEYTMIGKPLTELYRLESISEDNTINFFDETAVSTNYNLDILLQYLYERRKIDSKPEWQYFLNDVKNLKGVSFKKFYQMRKR